MRDTLATLHGLELDGGHDLEHAYGRCNFVGLTPQARTLVVPGITSAVRDFLVDVGNADVSNLRLQSRVIRGTERESGTPMNVLFKGRSRTLGFAARHVFGTGDFDLFEPRRVAREDYDVLVTDRPVLDRGVGISRSILAVPHWLRQRVELHDNWPATLAGLSAHLRKELRRLLRQRNYHARIVCDMPAKLDFYERCLLPFLESRFGSGAVVPKRRTYQREADSSVLFKLYAGSEFLGASLLKHDFNTLFVGRTAFCSERAAPSEVLDFLCLVLAQRLSCRYLDLGLTRPHVEDGALAYKSKWGPHLVSSGSLKSSIRIRPLRASAATLGFLSRNGFIERQARRFVVRRLRIGSEPDANTLSEFAALAERVSLDRIIVGFSGDSSRAVTHGRVTSRALNVADDPIRAFLGLR